MRDKKIKEEMGVEIDEEAGEEAIEEADA